MSRDVNVNKIDEEQKREAEHLATKLKHQGVGQDEAKKRALEEVAAEPNTGGNHGAGDAPKKAAQHHPHNAEEQSGGPK